MNCPVCGQVVSERARRCSLCGEELNDPRESPAERPDAVGPEVLVKPDRPDRRVLFGTIAALAVLVLIGARLAGGSTDRHDHASGSGSPASGSVASGSGADDDTTDKSADGGMTPTGPIVDLSSSASPVADSTSADGVDEANDPISYAADNLIDGSSTTAWRMNGDGSGSSIQFSFDQPVTVTKLGLINGYTKQDPATGIDRYSQERRLVQVTWTTDSGSYTQDLTDGDTELQSIDVEPVTTGSLTLTIEQTTDPGDTDYDYTAISEVVIDGMA